MTILSYLPVDPPLAQRNISRVSHHFHASPPGVLLAILSLYRPDVLLPPLLLFNRLQCDPPLVRSRHFRYLPLVLPIVPFYYLFLRILVYSIVVVKIWFL